MTTFLILCGLFGADQNDEAEVVFFEKRIRPVLVEHCYRCHSGQAKTPKGGLRLDSRAAIRRGGETGPAVVPGQVEESLLIQALRHETFEMPPDRKLPDRVIEDFVKPREETVGWTQVNEFSDARSQSDRTKLRQTSHT